MKTDRKIVCPNCGKTLPLNRSGRKPKNTPFKNISEALRACQNTELAAEKLGCSVGYIYQELNKKRLKPRDVINGKDHQSKGLGIERQSSGKVTISGN